MMKKITTLIAALSLSANVSGQSYSKLWQTVNNYTRDDLPQSALESVEQIRQKALSEKNDAQLMRALLMQRLLGAELSPDTAQTYLERMKQALAAEERPVMKALWHSALAQCYETIYSGYSFRTDEVTREQTQQEMKSHFLASLSDFDLLAQQKVKNYLPLITYNKGSQYYNDDLLHVLVSAYMGCSETTNKERREWHERLAAYYKEHQLPSAALLQSLEALQLKYQGVVTNGLLTKNPYYLALCQLAKEYEGEDVAVEVYNCMIVHFSSSALHSNNDTIQTANAQLLYQQAQHAIKRYAGTKKATNKLRNFVTEVTNPSVGMSVEQLNCYPADTLRLTVNFRNVEIAQLRLVKLTSSREEYEQKRRSDELAALRSRHLKSAPTYEVAREQAAQPYEWTTQTFSLTVPNEAGIYRLELVKNGRVATHSDFCISHLTALTFSKITDKMHRVTVVDQRTGQPVPYATLTTYRDGAWSVNGHRLQKIRTLTTDELGTALFEDNFSYVAVSDSTDAAAPLFNLNKIYSQRRADDKSSHLQLYTDRSIYRPGQKVEFAGVAYRKEDDHFEVRRGLETKVELRDVNHKLVDTLLVKTDDMGSFNGAFTLPAHCLPGDFTLKATKGGSALSFKVEEYKRPTFTATTQPVTTAYALGDTVRVSGKATTYSGVSVGGARVQYTVQRRAWFFWNDRDEVAPQSGETTTDAEGQFTLPVSLTRADEYEKITHYNRYSYTVNYTVTAPNGETTQGSTVLSVATRPAYVTANVPQVIYRRKGKALPTFTFRQLNAAGEEKDTVGRYQLFLRDELKSEGTFHTSEPLSLPSLSTLPSGLYTLRYRTAEAEEETATFTLLSETDQRPVDPTADFFCYEERNEQGDSVRVVVGSSCPDAVLFYDLLTADSVRESRRIELHNELRHFDLAYQPLYGDGATLYLALQRNGTLHEKEIILVKPQPNKALKLEWSTFRSRLTPGQQEEWRLRVTQPDGKPADAEVMACLYDASLDALYPSTWQPFQIHFNRTLPSAWWRSIFYNQPLHLSVSDKIKYLSTSSLAFSTWRGELFDYYHSAYRFRTYIGGPMRSMHNRVMLMDMNEEMAAPLACSAAPGYAEKMEIDGVGATNDLAMATPVTPRTNFSETAFFCPALRTDAKGEVSLSFTLPESLTQWQFRALAHDGEMNNGQLDASVVARKELMVEPALPRFLREGDTTNLPVKVTNLSEKPLEATLQMTLTDALSNVSRMQQKQKITLQPGETRVYAFPYTSKNDEGVLLCTTTAQAAGFSDGEEHYLPVLSNQVEVTRSLPFSLTEKGTQSLRIDTLFNAEGATHKALSVELSSNPTWYAVTALPYLAAEGNCLNAVEWATRLYSLDVARQVAANSPELRRLTQSGSEEVSQLGQLKLEGLTDATPWLQQGETQKQRAQALGQLFDENAVAVNLHTAIDKLRALQNAEGGFSWYPGMPANVYTTVDVAILLARIEALTPFNEAHSVLAKAKNFLDEKIARAVDDMKQWEKEHNEKQTPSEWQLRYLYLRTLMSEKPDRNATYLLDRAASLQREFTMYGKAVTALVLKQAGRTAEAESTLESLLEHTVSSSEMGRYFDTPRAEWCWQSYRIPTQCAAIEALQQFGQTARADEMRLALMQAKRTQMWETSRATADAVYALLSTATDSTQTPSLTVMPLKEQTPVYYTLYNDKKVVGFNAQAESKTPQTVGYFKQTYTTDEATQATSLTLRKTTDGLSWGSVYATFMAPASEVDTEGKGLTLTRRFEVKKGTAWVAVAENEPLKKGDRVRQVFKITADRDYDFVSLSASRPACLEPAQSLSGYDWNDGLPAYRAVRDDRTDYFIEKLSKGQHQFTEELFVDRSGTFGTGISKIACVYAPEFCGTAAETKLRTE